MSLQYTVPLAPLSRTPLHYTSRPHKQGQGSSTFFIPKRMPGIFTYIGVKEGQCRQKVGQRGASEDDLWKIPCDCHRRPSDR